MKDFLCNLEQGIETGPLIPLSRKLIDPKLVDHSNNLIPMILSCCLTDLLRIFAPEPRYGNNELLDIFNLFIKQLKKMDRTNSELFPFCFYLLEKLALVKIFVKLVDLEEEELLVKLFKTLYRVYNQEK
ncbi:precocious dissociation of sisters 5 [Anaeramoeba flamelloides]|uniref:Precocious dissociation of sisters 5 n=1 Tax=Anaeramoeba flamelloides TaxID=1746091 RepID=A0ABQ8XTU5_9EUKA|nr:precocious dissociation of sisters 5 [Anaeramoeba flamelloides]